MAPTKPPKLHKKQCSTNKLYIYHIKALKELINQRKKDKKATIVCTHIAPYAAELCERAFIIEAGKLEEVSKWESSDILERISLMEERF